MHPAPVADLDAIAALRNDLAAAGYTADNIAEILGPTATAALDREQHIPARRALAQPLAEGNPLAGFISCFMLADPISRELAETMFATLGVERAVTLGLVIESETHQVQAVLDLSAYATDDPGDLWVASDQTALQLGEPLPADHILGVGKASLTLAQITPRHQVDTALDIGTGCGIQALHLLTHARHVTITDVSDRAVKFAVFNILLNAPTLDVDPHNLSDRVTVAVGNMLEPVVGQTFELVVTNPPFVIAPAQASVTHTYRETGQTGDQLLEVVDDRVDVLLVVGHRGQDGVEVGDDVPDQLVAIREGLCEGRRGGEEVLYGPGLALEHHDDRFRQLVDLARVERSEQRAEPAEQGIEVESR